VSEERSTVEILRAARERITPIDQWTQHVHARAKQGGEEVDIFDPDDPPASCWCAVGALQQEGVEFPYGKDILVEPSAEMTFLIQAAEELDPKRGWPPTLNDLGSRAEAHARVLAMYDRAIELAEDDE
jgi:hypothetical protein